VVGLSEDQFLTALEQALGAAAIAPQSANPGRRATTVGLGYRFAHPLIREALYEDISVPRRVRIHKLVGEALEEFDRLQDGAEPDRVTTQRIAMLAQHFGHAAGREDAEKAVRYSRQAGDRASDMLAYEDAAQHYARALELLERFEPERDRLRLELLLSLAESHVRAGDRPLASEPLRRAAELALKLSDPDSLGRAAVAASRRYIQQPGVIDEELILLLDRALEVTKGEVSTLRVRLLARLCGALYFSAQRDRMVALSEEATGIASQLSDPGARTLAAAARRRAFWGPAQLDRRLADSAEILRFAREADDPELILQGHAWLIVDLLEHGDIDAVEAQIEAFQHLAEQVRQPLYDWQAAVWRAMRALLSGQLEEAERLAEQALATGARAEPISARQYYGIQLLEIRREQGRMSELEPALRQTLEQVPNRLAYRAALGVLLTRASRDDEAREAVEPLRFADVTEDLDWLVTMSLLADVYADLGDDTRGGELYELLLPYQSVSVVIGFAAACEGPIARVLGRLAAVIGRPQAADGHFQRALEMAERLRAPLLKARTEADMARARGGDG
jgi:tetratricopeptide (TPR) repeat protein